MQIKKGMRKPEIFQSLIKVFGVCLYEKFHLNYSVESDIYVRSVSVKMKLIYKERQ